MPRFLQLVSKRNKGLNITSTSDDLENNVERDIPSFWTGIFRGRVECLIFVGNFYQTRKHLSEFRIKIEGDPAVV